MLEGLLRMEDGSDPPLCADVLRQPVHIFMYGEDDMGVVQHIPQGEGGEQGDPLMPMLFALGQHQALVQTQAKVEGQREGDGVPR